ncbi:MAG: hypothetical protein AMXMBFR33_48070 [Candidatus Xenobia bacterium]
MHVTRVNLTPSFLARPQAAGRPSGSSDRVELSAPVAPDRAPEPCPPELLLEIRQVFKPRHDDYSPSYARNTDTSRDTGVEIRHQSGGGGCFGPSEHYWTLTVPGEESEQIAIGTGVLSSASGCSVNSDGTFVVGQFSLYDSRKEGRRERDLQELRDKGLYEGEERWQSPSYLVDVPLRKGIFGKLPAALRRRGWLPQKVLTALPPDAGAFDVGPDKSVAVAQNDRVLRYTRKHGLQPWLQLSQKVEDLEYLSDGSLAVMTSSARVGSDIYLFRSGQAKEPRFVPFSEAFPEVYERRLRERVQSVDFLRQASLPEVERFLDNCDWIKDSRDSWRPWQPSSSASGLQKSAVVLWKQSPELWTYDRSSGQATSLGPLAYPESERFAKIERHQFEPEITQDGAYLVARSAPAREGAAVDVAVWDLVTGKSELVPGVRQVELDTEKNQLRVQIVTGEQKLIALDSVASLKKEDWYLKARMADLLDSGAELKPDRQISEDQEKVIVGGVQVRKRDE